MQVVLVALDAELEAEVAAALYDGRIADLDVALVAGRDILGVAGRLLDALGQLGVLDLLLAVDNADDLVLEVLGEYLVGDLGRLLQIVQLDVVLDGEHRCHEHVGVALVEARLVDRLAPVLVELALVLVLGKDAHAFAALALLDELDGLLQVRLVRVRLLAADELVLGQVVVLLAILDLCISYISICK